MDVIKRWWVERTPAFRAAVNTAWQTFLAVFAPAALGWLGEVQDWAGSPSDTAFPGLDALGKAAVAAVAAVIAAALAYGYRRAKPPSYDPAKQPPVSDL